MYIDGKYEMFILDIYKIMNGLIRFFLCFCFYWLDIIIRNVRKKKFDLNFIYFFI